jgi:hypothetical protein
VLGSWLIAWQLVHPWAPRRSWAGFVPWAAVHSMLYVSALWIMSQPMDMRGTLLSN